MSRRVLVIDDDQTLVAPLKEGLESMGFSVSVAFDGLQGILMAHMARPDLIFLDFHMPGGGGATVYERLRETPDTAETPIVFSTVVPVDELTGKIKRTPHTYFLKKPASLAQIVSTIAQVLGEAS